MEQLSKIGFHGAHMKYQDIEIFKELCAYQDTGVMPEEIPALIAEVERLRGVESKLAYEKLANKTIPNMNGLVKRSADKIGKLKSENATLIRTLGQAENDMEYVAVTGHACNVCGYGCKGECSRCAHFKWRGIQQAQEQEGQK